MSVQLGLFDDGSDRSINGSGNDAKLESLKREMRYLLTISHNAGGVGQPTPAGIAHAFGVCLIEGWNMARGKGGSKEAGNATAMPRFVDVKLTAEQRVEFTTWEKRGGDLITFLQSLAADGYRVGVTWSGEHQSYTVSLTCRDPHSVNDGLCMTSFAGTLSTALWLAIYKHVVVTEENWLGGLSASEADFG